MVKGKDVWILVFLECIVCVWNSVNKELMGIFRYII